MPFVNRCGGQAVDLQNKTITASTDSQIITPDSGYDGLNQITVPAYALRYGQKSADSIMSSGGGSSTSSNNNTIYCTLENDFGTLPSTYPDQIVVNAKLPSGNTLYISSDSNASSYDEAGIITINATRNGEKTYMSYVTAYTGYFNISDLNDVSYNSTLRVYNGFTTSYKYAYGPGSDGMHVVITIPEADNAITDLQQRPKFYTKASNTSTSRIPCCFRNNYFMYSYALNENYAVSYSIMCFWNVSSDAYPADNTTT